MTTKYHQITLKETFSDCQDRFFDDIPSFFWLLEEHIDMNLFLPAFSVLSIRSWDGNVPPLLSISFRLLSFRRFFPFLPVPSSSSSLVSVKNCGSSAGPKKSLIHLFSPALSRGSFPSRASN